MTESTEMQVITNNLDMWLFYSMTSKILLYLVQKGQDICLILYSIMDVVETSISI